MRSRRTWLLLAITLLIACGEAGPATNNAPSPTPADGKAVPAPETSPPAAPPSAGPRLHCDSLDGLAYTVTYYADNRPEGTDVLRFVDGKMICEGCPETGLKPGMFECEQLGPESLAVRMMMLKESVLMRRYGFVLTPDGMDGRVDMRGDDGKYVSQAFSGKPDQ